MLLNPFEQFEIMILYIIGHNPSLGVDLSMSNMQMTLCCMLGFLLLWSETMGKSYSLMPNNWQKLHEVFYVFLFSMMSEQVGKRGYKFFPHIYTVFFTVLLYNLVGLLPFSFTVSSHIIVTLTLAMSYFMAWIMIAMKTLSNDFLSVFCPSNMPSWLLPLLVTVELLSFTLSPFSLGMRLFANMLAGHILLHMVAGSLIYSAKMAIILMIPIFIVLSAIGVLEMGISFLQAYIFAILLGIYLKDSLVSH